jgi:hypothetical protein
LDFNIMVLKLAIAKTTKCLFVAILGIGTILVGTPQLAQAQSISPATREAIVELDLSFAQMMQLRDVMGGYNAALEGILTPAQLDLMNALREETANEGAEASSEPPSDLWTQLDLTEFQVAELAVVRADMVTDFEAVLTPEQLETATEIGFIDQF